MYFINQIILNTIEILIVNTDKKPQTKLVVLKPHIDNLEIQDIVEKKKTDYFRHLLRKPDKSEVHVHSLTLIYEPVMILSGKYNADFLRKSIHEVKVDHNVKEIIFGEGVFPASNYTVTNKFGSKLRGNTIPLELEEHVFVVEEKELVLDHHGEIRNFTYKVDTKDVENYPKRILEKNTVKEFEITEETAIKKLAKSFQTHEKFDDVRNLNESITISEITITYIPIYEARLIGPKKKVAILRFDTIKKKLL